MAQSLRNIINSVDNAMVVPMACLADFAAAWMREDTQSVSLPSTNAMCAAAQKTSECDSVDTEVLSLDSALSMKCHVV